MPAERKQKEMNNNEEKNMSFFSKKIVLKMNGIQNATATGMHAETRFIPFCLQYSIPASIAVMNAVTFIMKTYEI